MVSKIPRPKLHQMYISMKNIAPRVIIDLFLNNINLPINDSVSNPGPLYLFKIEIKAKTIHIKPDCAHAVLMISQSDSL